MRREVYPIGLQYIGTRDRETDLRVELKGGDTMESRSLHRMHTTVIIDEGRGEGREKKKKKKEDPKAMEGRQEGRCDKMTGATLLVSPDWV